MDDHLSRRTVTSALQRPTIRHTTGSRYIVPVLGLAPGGVYMDAVRYRTAGELLPRLFTLTADAAVYFCCTFLEVAFTGRYPAPLPCGARTFLITEVTRPSDLLAGGLLISIRLYQFRDPFDNYNSTNGSISVSATRISASPSSNSRSWAAILSPNSTSVP